MTISSVQAQFVGKHFIAITFFHKSTTTEKTMQKKNNPFVKVFLFSLVVFFVA